MSKEIYWILGALGAGGAGYLLWRLQEVQASKPDCTYQTVWLSKEGAQTYAIDKCDNKVNVAKRWIADTNVPSGQSAQLVMFPADQKLGAPTRPEILATK